MIMVNVPFVYMEETAVVIVADQETFVSLLGSRHTVYTHMYAQVSEK